jgi:hypothetical protein
MLVIEEKIDVGFAGICPDKRAAITLFQRSRVLIFKFFDNKIEF